MNPNIPYYQPPAMRLAQLENQYLQNQPGYIHNLQGVQPQVQCFFVSSPNDLTSINVMPGVVYIGINKPADEIYIRQLNTDGNIELKTFKKESGTEQMTEIRAIMTKLENIEKRIGGNTNEYIATTGATGTVGDVSEQPSNANV